MSKYSFLASPRWIGLIILMILASIVCYFLGEWQMGRYHEKVAAAEQIKGTWHQPTTTIEQVEADEDEWQLVEMTGEFVPDSQLLLRGRSVSGSAAYQVINLFVTESNGEPITVIVDRGWIPRVQADGDAGVEGFVPEAPTGEVTIQARTRPSEEPHDRVPAEGYLYTVTPEKVVEALPDSMTAGLPEFFDGRFELSADQPGSNAAGAPQPYPKPSTSLGSHLAYTWEWRFFAVAALAVVPILARRESKENSWVVDGVDLSELDLTDEELRDLGLLKETERPSRRRSGPTDEEIEDSILDEAGSIGR